MSIKNKLGSLLLANFNSIMKCYDEKYYVPLALALTLSRGEISFAEASIPLPLLLSPGQLVISLSAQERDPAELLVFVFVCLAIFIQCDVLLGSSASQKSGAVLIA